MTTTLSGLGAGHDHERSATVPASLISRRGRRLYCVLDAPPSDFAPDPATFPGRDADFLSPACRTSHSYDNYTVNLPPSAPLRIYVPINRKRDTLY